MKAGQPNRAKEALLSADRLRHVLAYEPATGVFFSKVRNTHWQVGKVVGRMTVHGYVDIKIDGHTFMAHRLAWLHVHGTWPVEFLDHINGDRRDNRIANLREATAKENGENRRKPNRNSSTGLLGVHLKWTTKSGEQRFSSSLRIGGKLKKLGYFASAEEAHAAYVAAKREHQTGNTL